MKVIVLGEELQGSFAIRSCTGVFVFMKFSFLVCVSWSVITASHFYSNLGIKKSKLIFFAA
jgi:hypothetical protein